MILSSVLETPELSKTEICLFFHSWGCRVTFSFSCIFFLLYFILFVIITYASLSIKVITSTLLSVCRSQVQSLIFLKPLFGPWPQWQGRMPRALCYPVQDKQQIVSVIGGRGRGCMPLEFDCGRIPLLDQSVWNWEWRWFKISRTLLRRGEMTLMRNIVLKKKRRILFQPFLKSSKRRIRWRGKLGNWWPKETH